MAAVDVQLAVGNGLTSDNTDACCSRNDVEHGTEEVVVPRRNGMFSGPQHSLSSPEEINRVRGELAKLHRENEEKRQQLEDLNARATLQQEVDRSRLRDVTSANEDLKEQLRALSSENEQRGRDLDRCSSCAASVVFFVFHIYIPGLMLLPGHHEGLVLGSPPCLLACCIFKALVARFQFFFCQQSRLVKTLTEDILSDLAVSERRSGTQPERATDTQGV